MRPVSLLVNEDTESQVANESKGYTVHVHKDVWYLMNTFDRFPNTPNPGTFCYKSMGVQLQLWHDNGRFWDVKWSTLMQVKNSGSNSS